MSADGGPAFPVYEWDDSLQQVISRGGMTLRDYFAAKAMLCLLDELPWQKKESVAQAAYAMADAMLKARQQ